MTEDHDLSNYHVPAQIVNKEFAQYAMIVLADRGLTVEKILFDVQQELKRLKQELEYQLREKNNLTEELERLKAVQVTKKE